MRDKLKCEVFWPLLPKKYLVGGLRKWRRSVMPPKRKWAMAICGKPSWANLNFVYRKGRGQRSGPLALKYILNNREENFRFAVVVSKKVEKTAVGRNKIRRRVSAAFEAYKNKIPTAYDLVISVYDTKAGDLPMPELEARIKEMLGKAGII